jgi:hypothetical protein
MKVIVGNEEIELKIEDTKFTEATLNEYLMKDAATYSYYHAKYVDAQYYATKHEDLHEALYSKKFQERKEAGATDKLAEAMAKIDDEVTAAKDKARLAKRSKELLYGFLKALEKAHDNAINLGYNVRKEMSVLQNNQVKSLEDIMH